MILAVDVAGMVALSVVGIVLLVGLTLLVVFARIFNQWSRAFLAGAPISLPNIIGMRFRRVPVDEMVRLRIMAVQAGIELRMAQIESAYLQGVDVELAIRALIEAKNTGKVVTWEDAIATDVHERLRAILFPDGS